MTGEGSTAHPGGHRSTGDEPAWLADVGRVLGAVRQAAAGAGTGQGGARVEDLLRDAGHAAQCRSCPMCQGVAVLRLVGPDLLDQLSRAAAGLAASLRAAAADQDEPSGDRDAGEHAGPATGAQGGGGAPAAGTPERPVPRTVPIDVTD